jgi:hypothetical protein
VPEFRVQLFPPEKAKGLLGGLKTLVIALRKPKREDRLDLRIGSPTAQGHHVVDVFYRDNKIGEVRKKGIDEMIEKGALGSARYYDKGRITLLRLEPYEYRNSAEYKAWSKRYKGNEEGSASP